MDIASSIRSRSIKLKPDHPSTFCRSNTADYGSLFWTFDPDNHYLSAKLTNLVYSRCVIRIVAITWISLIFIGIPLRAIATPTALTVYFVLFVMTSCIRLPFYLFVILSFNRDACAFILKSSEFWIKVIYCVVFISLEFVLYHKVTRHGELKDLPEYLGYTARAVGMINGPLFMIIVGGMDAIPRMQYKWKLWLMGAVAFMYFTLFLKYQLTEPGSDDYIIRLGSTGKIISICSLLASVSGMLLMFLCKQMIDVVRNKDRCICINYKPYLRWESMRDDSELLESVIPETTTVIIETQSN